MGGPLGILLSFVRFFMIRWVELIHPNLTVAYYLISSKSKEIMLSNGTPTRAGKFNLMIRPLSPSLSSPLFISFQEKQRENGRRNKRRNGEIAVAPPRETQRLSSLALRRRCGCN